MKTFIICVVFAQFAGTFANRSQYTEIANDVLDLEWYKSGIFFTHKISTSGLSTNGIIPMYKKISNYSAFYGIFQYNRNKFAAEEAVRMFNTALASVNPETLDAKTFVKEELKKIDKRLMQDDITGERAESETKALIVLLGATSFTVAEVGDMGKYLFTKNMTFFKESLLPVKMESSESRNVLGGKAKKTTNPNTRGDAKVMQFSAMKWIVLGTKSLSSLSESQIKHKVLKNAKDLKKAAQEITKLIKLPKDETDSGVIVIDGHPLLPGEECVVCFNLGCFQIPM